VLLVDGVIDALGTADTLTVGCPEPLTVAGELGEMVADTPPGLACPEAEATDGLGVAEAPTDPVFVAATEGDPLADPVFTLWAVPSPLELGVMTPDGDPVTVCPLHVIRGLGETVACADPLIPLGLPVGVG
jgi:hypothetical protein